MSDLEEMYFAAVARAEAAEATLKRVRGAWRKDHREMLAQFDKVTAERDAALAALERVRAQHRVDKYTEGRVVTRCVCEEKWPCSTMAALAPVTEEGEARG